MQKLTVEKKAENAIIWIEGLFKTDKKQGSNMLGSVEHGFCCLGYGCQKLGNIEFLSSDEYSEKFMQSVGLHSEQGQFIEGLYDARDSLAELNDSGEYTFVQIAEVIKECASNLFEHDVATLINKHYHSDKTLHLNLKKCWFDMIQSGYKKEEYRAIKKHWIRQLINKQFSWDCSTVEDIEMHLTCCANAFFKKFNTITFSNGYAKDRDQFVIELKSIEINTGNVDWGAVEGEKYFVLKLGEII